MLWTFTEICGAKIVHKWGMQVKFDSSSRMPKVCRDGLELFLVQLAVTHLQVHGI